MLNRALIKDGKPYPPANLAETELLPGVVSACKTFKEKGFHLVVVTNQPDVARGTTLKVSVEEINQYLEQELGIDEFRTCYHDTKNACNCRKPLPGSILDAAKARGLDLSRCFMVGDRWRDIEAGHAAGVKTVFIDYGYNEKRPLSFDFKASSLIDAIPFILGEKL